LGFSYNEGHIVLYVLYRERTDECGQAREYRYIGYIEKILACF